MNYPKNQLFIMPSNHELTNSWASTFKKQADFSKIIYSDSYKLEGFAGFLEIVTKEIELNNVNLLFIDVSTAILNPFSLYELKKKYSLLIVCLGIDDEYKFDWITSSYATVSDLFITTDFVSKYRYKMAGINAHYLPLPVEIPSEFIQHQEAKPQASFVGQIASYKGTRAEVKKFLVESMSPVDWFPKSGAAIDFIPREEMNWIFKNSQINLSFSGLSSIIKNDNPLSLRARGMKLRPFEILGAGGFCLSEYSVSLSKSLVDGEDLVYYYSKDDLINKIKFYLDNPQEAKKIAKQGHEKVVNNYSVESTSNKLKILIEDTLKLESNNLFNEDLIPGISRSFLGVHMELVMESMIKSLIKLRIKFFILEAKYTINFLKNSKRSLPASELITILTKTFYRTIKTILKPIFSKGS